MHTFGFTELILKAGNALSFPYFCSSFCLLKRLKQLFMKYNILAKSMHVEQFLNPTLLSILRSLSQNDNRRKYLIRREEREQKKRK